MWVVRAGKGGESVEDFLSRGVVAFEGKELGPLSAAITKEELLRLFGERYSSEKPGSRASWASQLFRFISAMKVGDLVVLPDPERRRLVIGKVGGPYEYKPDEEGRYGHIRKVTWDREASRDGLSVETRNTLGAIQTIFTVNEKVEAELLAAAVALGSTAVAAPRPIETKTEADEALTQITGATFQRAEELIEDAINALTWDQVQELAAGILRAMGYRTKVSPKGGDRGVDIFASPDGLGLEEPRIFVEVKHQPRNQMGAPEIRSFLGGRKAGDRLLYVSTGGFTKEAKYEAERSSVPLTLVSLPRLRELFVDFYEKLDNETRTLVPLRRLYWPSVSVDG